MPRPSRKAKEVAAESIHNASSTKTTPQDGIQDASSELYDDSDADQTFEIVNRRMKTPKQMPQSAGSSVAKRPRRTPSVASQSTVAKPGEIPEGSMFEIVFDGRSSLTAVIDDWIEGYNQDHDGALLELTQFFIHSCGCKGRISPEMYQIQDHTDLIRRMTEEFDEDSGDYPLIMAGPQWKKFKSNLCEFIQVLVRQCQYSIIYDQYLMDNLISLLTGLTDSQVRAFRHTSTLAAMKLMSALVEVALSLSTALDHTTRQFEAERLKARGKQATERLEMLMHKKTEVEENQEEVKNMLTYIFKGVFVHRYRDTQPDIRGICMAEIGVWMKRYPAMFLDDSYLKYVGWTLYDRVGEVRLGCLKCLQPLYDTDAMATRLELFTNRFKDRLVEMTLDKEYDVAVQAVKVVCAILKCNAHILSDKDCENVYELVYSSHRGVAQAAGDFLNTKLFAMELDEISRSAHTRRGKKRSENTPRIRDLVQFFIESELHEHGAYLVDSLWDINPMLKDWECMTDLLLEEPGRGEEAMDDRQESSLIEIMVCCVRQAATGEYPVGRGPSRKLSSKETRAVIEDKVKLTEHFITTLPGLLAKYKVDSEKIANLLQIPLYFDIEIYSVSRQEKNLESLLLHIADVVDKHTDSEVLESCSKVMYQLCEDDYTIAPKCQTALATLVDTLVQKYNDAFAKFFNGEYEPDEDDAYSLLASLKRIYAFYCCHNINSANLWNSLYSIVDQGKESNTTIPDEIVCKALSCSNMAIVWQLQELSISSNPVREVMGELLERLRNLLQLCELLLVSAPDKVQEEVYLIMCDLLIMFGPHLETNHAKLSGLNFQIDETLQQKLADFLCDKVFVDDDEEETDENQKIEQLHKRRNFLAGFCKLVVYNAVPIRCASEMFKYYMRYYNDYGDIIKATLSKTREINKITTSKTLAKSLTQLYKELQMEQGGRIDRTSEGFQAIKELARRFNLSFGLDQMKNREAVYAMHLEGMTFATTEDTGEKVTGRDPPTNLSFLEVLVEFTSKLLKPDKKAVLQMLDKLIPNSGAERDDSWLPLLTYRNSLIQGESDTMRPPPPVAKGRGRAKRKQATESVMSADDNWANDTPLARGQGVGPLTSTVMKRRKVGEPDIESGESDHGTEASSEKGSERDFDQPNRPRITLRIRKDQLQT